MIRLRFKTDVALMVGLGVLAEADIAYGTRGGNELDVVSLSGLDGEQLAQLARLVRDPIAGQAPEPEAASVPPEGVAGTQDQAVTWVGEMPPRSGAGATRDAWAAFAEANQVPFPADASRDDIIKLVEAHRGS